jgi:hypothetical protein
MGHDAFLRGEYDTSFLGDQFSLAEPDRESHRHLAAIVATILSHEQRQRVRLTPTLYEEVSGSDSWRAAQSWKLVGRQEAMGR